MLLTSKKAVRSLSLMAYCWLLVTSAYSQVPFIKSISAAYSKSQQTIAIQGINFGTNASDIRVFFGGVSVMPQRISDQLIEAIVPAEATFDEIGVGNILTGRIGFSKERFLMSFGGTNPFNTTSVAGQYDFNSESGLYDFAMADFDGDGKNDFASANDNFTSIDVFLNTSSVGSLSFTKSLLAVGAINFHVTASDLNGDGKPEILVTEKNGSRIFVFKNNSSIGSLSFAMQTLTLTTGAKASQVKSKDLDLDGKADLVITDQSQGRIFVVPNSSNLATIQFGSLISITLGGSVNVDGLELGDLNNDGLTDIIASEFLTSTGNISLVQNASSPGNFTFNIPQLYQPGTTISNMKVGDFDGDGKPDLAATGLLANGVLLFRNKSTSSIILDAPVLIDANAKPWGIDLGDVDGDGKIDIVVASVTQKAVTVLSNQSSSGTFKFAKGSLSTTYINRAVRIGDLDSDGRPDIAFTSIDDNNLSIPASKISVFRNLNCVVPVISPSGPITVCSTLTQRLTASANKGAMYEWFKGGTSLGAPSATQYYDVTASGTYTVTITNGSCTQSSNSVQVTIVTQSSLPTATPNPVSPVCVNGTLTLSVNDVGASDYVWTGPGSFVGHGQSVARTNFQPDQAGVYNLEVMIGTCVTQRASLVVDVVSVPQISIITSGADLICQGQQKQLTAYPTVNGYNYQWAEQTAGDIGGATSSTYNATTSGSYLIKLTSASNPTCPVIQSSPKTVRVAKVPVVDFTAPASGCTGQQIIFTDQTQLDPDTVGLKVRYLWNFGDNVGTSTETSPTYIYATASTYSINLSVSYLNQSCLTSNSKSLVIQSTPSLTISTPSGVFKFCPGDSLFVQASSGFDSYLWANGKTTNTTFVKIGGNFSIQAKIGACTLTTNQNIFEFPEPSIAISATPSSIKEGSTVQLLASGLTDYLWTPDSTLSNPLIANPVATPKQTTTYTVTGEDSNGCAGKKSIDVFVTKDNAINSLAPSNFFSPNGDTINDTWQVQNAPVQIQCGVEIFDERGYKVYESKPYQNNWNGVSAKGSILPAGVYYYVIKCDDSPGDFKAGSINIVR